MNYKLIFTFLGFFFYLQFLNYEFLKSPNSSPSSESLKSFHISTLFLPFFKNIFNLFSIYFLEITSLSFITLSTLYISQEFNPHYFERKKASFRKKFLLFCRWVANCSLPFSFYRFQCFCYPTNALDIIFMVDQYMGMLILTWKKWIWILKEKRYECILHFFVFMLRGSFILIWDL